MGGVLIFIRECCIRREAYILSEFNQKTPLLQWLKVEQCSVSPSPSVAMALRSASPLLLAFCLVVLACSSLVNGASCALKDHTISLRKFHLVEGVGTFEMECSVIIIGCQGGCDTEVRPRIHSTGDSDDYCKYDIECCKPGATSQKYSTLTGCEWVDPASPGSGHSTPTGEIESYLGPTTCSCHTGCYSGSKASKCQKIF